MYDVLQKNTRLGPRLKKLVALQFVPFPESFHKIDDVVVTSYELLTKYITDAPSRLAREQLMRPWALLVLDEAHSAMSNSCWKSISSVRNNVGGEGVRAVGLTGTPYRKQDEYSKPTLGVRGASQFLDRLGPQLHRVSPQHLEQEGAIAKMTFICVEVPCSSPGEATLLEAKDQLAFSDAKLQAVFDIVATHRKLGQRGLVYVDKLAIVKDFERMSDAWGATRVRYVSGTGKATVIKKVFEDLKKGMVDVVVLSRMGDESIDLPEVAFAVQIDWKGDSHQQKIQRAGRVARNPGGLRDQKQATVYFLVSHDSTCEEWRNMIAFKEVLKRCEGYDLHRMTAAAVASAAPKERYLVPPNSTTMAHRQEDMYARGVASKARALEAERLGSRIKRDARDIPTVMREHFRKVARDLKARREKDLDGIYDKAYETALNDFRAGRVVQQKHPFARILKGGEESESEDEDPFDPTDLVYNVEWARKPVTQQPVAQQPVSPIVKRIKRAKLDLDAVISSVQRLQLVVNRPQRTLIFPQKQATPGQIWEQTILLEACMGQSRNADALALHGIEGMPLMPDELDLHLGAYRLRNTPDNSCDRQDARHVSVRETWKDKIVPPVPKMRNVQFDSKDKTVPAAPKLKKVQHNIDHSRGTVDLASIALALLSCFMQESMRSASKRNASYVEPYDLDACPPTASYVIELIAWVARGEQPTKHDANDELLFPPQLRNAPCHVTDAVNYLHVISDDHMEEKFSFAKKRVMKTVDGGAELRRTNCQQGVFLYCYTLLLQFHEAIEATDPGVAAVRTARADVRAVLVFANEHDKAAVRYRNSVLIHLMSQINSGGPHFSESDIDSMKAAVENLPRARAEQIADVVMHPLNDPTGKKFRDDLLAKLLRTMYPTAGKEQIQKRMKNCKGSRGPFGNNGEPTDVGMARLYNQYMHDCHQRPGNVAHLIRSVRLHANFNRTEWVTADGSKAVPATDEQGFPVHAVARDWPPDVYNATVVGNATPTDAASLVKLRAVPENMHGMTRDIAAYAAKSQAAVARHYVPGVKAENVAHSDRYSNRLRGMIAIAAALVTKEEIAEFIESPPPWSEREGVYVSTCKTKWARWSIASRMAFTGFHRPHTPFEFDPASPLPWHSIVEINPSNASEEYAFGPPKGWDVVRAFSVPRSRVHVVADELVSLAETARTKKRLSEAMLAPRQCVVSGLGMQKNRDEPASDSYADRIMKKAATQLGVLANKYEEVVVQVRLMPPSSSLLFEYEESAQLADIAQFIKNTPLLPIDDGLQRVAVQVRGLGCYTDLMNDYDGKTKLRTAVSTFCEYYTRSAQVIVLSSVEERAEAVRTTLLGEETSQWSEAMKNHFQMALERGSRKHDFAVSQLAAWHPEFVHIVAPQRAAAAAVLNESVEEGSASGSEPDSGSESGSEPEADADANLDI